MAIPRIWPLPPDAELQRKLRADERNAQGFQYLNDNMQSADERRSSGLFSGGGDRQTSALSAYLVPAGGIIMWSGAIADIPAGWLLCDGSNSTPDLRDRFIVGAKQDDSGTAKTNITGSLTQSGGDIDYTPTGVLDVQIANHNAGTTGTPSATIGITPSPGVTTIPTGTHTHSFTPSAHVISVQDFIGDAAEIVPPYFALAYIMKT